MSTSDYLADHFVRVFGSVYPYVRVPVCLSVCVCVCVRMHVHVCACTYAMGNSNIYVQLQGMYICIPQLEG